jgi:hypothetical protein
VNNGLCTNASRRKGRGNQELVSAPLVGFEAVSEAGEENHKQNGKADFGQFSAKPCLKRLEAIDINLKGIRACEVTT